MIRKIVSFGAVVALGASSAAWCKGATQGTARVQLLDFSAQPGGNGFSTKPAAPSVVGQSMVSDFAGGFDAGQQEIVIDPQVAGAFNVVSRGGAGVVRTPRIAVPAWMRGGRAAFASQVLPTGLPAIGGCGNTDYTSSGLLKAVGEQRRKILFPLVVQYACRYGIPVGLFDAMIIQESGYNVTIRSPKGAFGLGQLMPGTAAQLGVDPYSIYGNLDGSARYLASHLREFNEPALALSAYNAGPGRVRKVWRIPRIAETQNYVRTILWNWQKLEWRKGQ